MFPPFEIDEDRPTESVHNILAAIIFKARQFDTMISVAV